MNVQRSSDPRIGDQVIIRDGILDDAIAVVRAVYKNLSISVVLNEEMLTPEQWGEIVSVFYRSPSTGKIHYVVEAGAYEVFNRVIVT